MVRKYQLQMPHLKVQREAIQATYNVKKNSRTESKEHLEITGGELKQDEALWLAAGWEPAGSSPLSEITAFVNDPKLSSVKISNK